jgi:hypothetical protein
MIGEIGLKSQHKGILYCHEQEKTMLPTNGTPSGTGIVILTQPGLVSSGLPGTHNSFEMPSICKLAVVQCNAFVVPSTQQASINLSWGARNTATFESRPIRLKRNITLGLV